MSFPFCAMILLPLIPGPSDEDVDVPVGEPYVLELSDEHPVYEGRGHRLRFALAGGEPCTWYVWADSSDFDPYLLAVNEGGEVLARDDDTGGGTCALIKVEGEGGPLFAVVTSPRPQESGSVTVHVSRSSETEETEAAEALVADALRASREAGDRGRAREVLEACVRDLHELEGAQESALVFAAMRQLVMPLRSLGSEGGTAAANTFCYDYLTRHLPETHPEWIQATLRQAVLVKEGGDLRAGRQLEQKAVDLLERLVDDDDLRLARARANLAVTTSMLGDDDTALALLTRAYEALDAGLPAGHPERNGVRGNLAILMKKAGRPDEAVALERRLVAEMRAAESPDRVTIAGIEMNLALTLTELGELESAQELLRKALATYEELLPPDHLNVVRARKNLASNLRVLGDLYEARRLQEEVMEVRSRRLPPGHPELVTAQLSQSLILTELGDLPAARELQQLVIDQAAEAGLPKPAAAVHDLSITAALAGRLEEARELHLEALRLAEEQSADAEFVNGVKQSLAATIKVLGEVSEALELEREILEFAQDRYPAGHPSLRLAMRNLAHTLRLRGNLEEALELQREVLDMALDLPVTHEDRHWARGQIAMTCLKSGRLVEAREHSLALLEDLRASLDEVQLISSAREVEEYLLARSDLFGLLFVAADALVEGEAAGALPRELFAWTESVRSVGLISFTLTRGVPRTEEIVSASTRLRAASVALVEGAHSGASDEALLVARTRRDRAQRDIVGFLAESGVADSALRPLDIEALRAACPQDAVLVGYWSTQADANEPGAPPAEVLLAHVLRPDGTLTKHVLGPLTEVSQKVDDWRAQLLVSRPRGRALGEGPDGERAAGEALRRLVLDPVLADVGEARRCLVALDADLHAVPLDALPLEDGVVGDRYSIELHTTLRELTLPVDAPPAGGSLLAFGDIEYDLDPKETGALAARGGEARLVRSGNWERGFLPLPETGAEVAAIASLYEKSFPGGEVRVLRGREASRRALVGQVADARYVHLATHGWFAPESVRSNRDRGGKGLTRETRVRGTSPMLLCGLALAGANVEVDEGGLIAGVLTAEELSSLDLGACELAVLSACETNVGVQRAGQGVASLQRALEFAGARSTLTSLWRVPDEATRLLMTDFYRRLWVLDKSPREALWEAKSAMRRKRDASDRPLYAKKDWAGWVMTGR